MATGITNFNVADGRGNGIVTAKSGDIIFVSADILRTIDDATVFARFSVNGTKLSEQTRYMGYNESWHVYVMTVMPSQTSTFKLEVGDNATPSVVEDIQSRMITLDTGVPTTGPKFTIYSIVTSPTPPPPGEAFNMWVQVTNIGEVGMGFLKVYDPGRNKYYVTDTLDHDAGEKIQYLYSITTDVETTKLVVMVGTGTTVQNSQEILMRSGGGLLSFSVLVQDSVTKSPIPNATVVADSKSTSTTNGSGKAFFTNQASGNHNLDVSATGYTTRSVTITLSYNDESFAVALSTGGDGGGTDGSLSGYVSDSISRALIPSASVLIVDANMQTTTNSKGYYLFQSVKAGSYNVQASKTGYNSSSADVSVVANKTTGKDFYLEKIPTDGDGPTGTGSLIGAVTDDDTKKPISGVVVNIIQLNKATLTDAYGAYRIDGIVVGTYIVGASIAGYDVSTASVIIMTDTVTKQDFALKPSKGGIQLPEDWWMWAGLGVGAVAIAGGAAVALSKKNNKRKKR